jgi:16S rRNA (cytosine967-C5)-methyltransferase
LVKQGKVENSIFLEASYCQKAADGMESTPQLEKKIYFQSQASQCIAWLLPLHKGAWILDLCAAPGGKSLLLSQRVAIQGRVIALDRNLHRIGLLQRQVRQYGILNLECVAGDAELLLPFRRCWDWILLDAPCSGLGTLRRNPEIRWRMTEEQLLQLQALQLRLLLNAAEVLALGGKMLYSTCSSEPEENEKVVGMFLARRPDFSLEFLDPPGALQRLVQGDGYFRTYPEFPDEDGFFAALLRRSATSEANPII